MCIEHNGYTIHFAQHLGNERFGIKPGFYFTIEVPEMGGFSQYCGPFIAEEAAAAYAKDVVDNHLNLFLAMPASMEIH